MEGRNRQIRRMIQSIASKVLKLVRTRIGSLEISSVEIGRYRALCQAEIKHLFSTH